MTLYPREIVGGQSTGFRYRTVGPRGPETALGAFLVRSEARRDLGDKMGNGVGV